MDSSGDGLAGSGAQSAQGLDARCPKCAADRGPRLEVGKQAQRGVLAQRVMVARIVERVKKAGIRTAIFVDPNPDMMRAAAATGVDRVEIYTEPYAAAFGTPRQQAELDRFRDTSRAAVAAGMKVNAGHDLDLRNMPLVAREIPEVDEVSIGHALICDALYIGLAEAVQRYARVCRGEAVDAPVTR